MHRAAVVLLALACGCGDNIEGVALAEWDAAQLQARCTYLTRCGMFADEAACDRYFRDETEPRLAEAIEARRLIYNPIAAKACLAWRATEQSCDLTAREQRVEPESCGRVFVGLQDGGEECAFDGECRSGNCAVEECPAETCCYGTCTDKHEPAAVDEGCVTDRDCAPETWCGKDQKCHALVDLAGECELDAQCVYGAGCIGATDLMKGNCRALPKIGERCPYKRCAELGALCTEGSCVPLGLPGQRCTDAEDCSPYTECLAASGTCSELPELGMPCRRACEGESWCDGADTQMCIPPKQNMEPCAVGVQCASGYCAPGDFFPYCLERAVCF